jgi:hypothetical protein
MGSGFKSRGVHQGKTAPGTRKRGQELFLYVREKDSDCAARNYLGKKSGTTTAELCSEDAGGIITGLGFLTERGTVHQSPG